MAQTSPSSQQTEPTVRLVDRARWRRIDGDRTTKRQATLNQEWAGSTNSEETTTYKDECMTDDVDEQQESSTTIAANSTRKARI